MTRSIFLFLTICVFVGLPLVLSGHSIGITSNALIAVLFAMAFNLLSGQAGMLSFGHAAYFAVGAFAVMHAMKAVEVGFLWCPTPLLPAFGGLAGLICGALAGFFATKRSGVYFSMVTLALAELLHAIAPNMAGVFGGEVGLSSMRMPWAGFDYGTEIEVYFTILAWVIVCIVLLYAYNQTLFGRLTVGLRESERRVSFLGYNAHYTKIVVFSISAMFSGIAGGLLVFVNESINYQIMSVGTSAAVILQTFVGGSSVFLGPALGAFVFTIFGSLVSDLTKNWLLYQGILFVFIMMFMGDGLAVLIRDIWHEIVERAWSILTLRFLMLIPGVLGAAGGIMLLELISKIMEREYQVVVSRTNAWPPVRVLGTVLDPTSVQAWLIPIALISICTVLLVLLQSSRKRKSQAVLNTREAANAH